MNFDLESGLTYKNKNITIEEIGNEFFRKKDETKFDFEIFNAKKIIDYKYINFGNKNIYLERKIFFICIKIEKLIEEKIFFKLFIGKNQNSLLSYNEIYYSNQIFSKNKIQTCIEEFEFLKKTIVQFSDFLFILYELGKYNFKIDKYLYINIPHKKYVIYIKIDKKESFIVHIKISDVKIKKVFNELVVNLNNILTFDKLLDYCILILECKENFLLKKNQNDQYVFEIDIKLEFAIDFKEKIIIQSDNQFLHTLLQNLIQNYSRKTYFAILFWKYFVKYKIISKTYNSSYFLFDTKHILNQNILLNAKNIDIENIDNFFYFLHKSFLLNRLLEILIFCKDKMKIVVEKDLGSFSISDYIKKNYKKINDDENFIVKEDKTENLFFVKTYSDSNFKQKIDLQKMMSINRIENYKSIQFFCNKYPFRIILKDKIYFDFLDLKINEKLKFLIEEEINCGLKYLKLIKIISCGNFNDVEKIFNNH